MNPIEKITRDKNGMFSTNSLAKSYSVESLNQGLTKKQKSNDYLKSLEQSTDSLIKPKLQKIGRDKDGMFVNVDSVDSFPPDGNNSIQESYKPEYNRSIKTNSRDSIQSRESRSDQDSITRAGFKYNSSDSFLFNQTNTEPSLPPTAPLSLENVNEKLGQFVVDAGIERPSSRNSIASRSSARDMLDSKEGISELLKPPTLPRSSMSDVGRGSRPSSVTSRPSKAIIRERSNSIQSSVGSSGPLLRRQSEQHISESGASNPVQPMETSQQKAVDASETESHASTDKRRSRRSTMSKQMNSSQSSVGKDTNSEPLSASSAPETPEPSVDVNNNETPAISEKTESTKPPSRRSSKTKESSFYGTSDAESTREKPPSRRSSLKRESLSKKVSKVNLAIPDTPKESPAVQSASDLPLETPLYSPNETKPLKKPKKSKSEKLAESDQEAKALKKQKKIRKEKSNQQLQEHLNDLTDEGALIPYIKESKPRKHKKEKKKEMPQVEIVEKQVIEEPVIVDKIDLLFRSLGHDQEYYQDSTIALTIEKTDSLVTSLHLRHPIVQVHIIDTSTGQYLLKSDATRPVTYFTEPTGINYILPTVTKPFDLKEKATKEPIWNETILFNESYLHLLQPAVIVLFEIIDVYTTLEQIKKKKDHFHRVAWAFLKPVGGTGHANTEKEARLQLYKYPTHLNPSSTNAISPFIYHVYQSGVRKRYPSTLYMSIKAHGVIHPPPPKIYDFDLTTPNTKPIDTTLSNLSIRSTPIWTRKPEELCKLPNKLHFRIEAGPLGSFASAISHNGLFIAVGCIGTNAHLIKIYNYVTGDRIATIQGHQDLVYTLTWSADDSELLSCSSDSSARVTTFNHDMRVIATSVFTHPSFVYCGVFHPTSQLGSRTIVTGGYDGIIRFWTYKQSQSVASSKPVLKLPAQEAIINSICFNKEGTRLYSGDGKGNVKIWAKTDTEFECIKTVDTLKGQSIHSLELHPGNRKLLVQTNKGLHLLDTRIHRFLTHYPPQQHTLSKPCFSACGTYIFAAVGNSVSIFKTESGRFLTSYSSQTIPSFPIVQVIQASYHPFDHTIVFSVYGHQGFLVFKWDQNYPELKMEPVKLTNKLGKHLDIDGIVTKSMQGLNVDTGAISVPAV